MIRGIKMETKKITCRGIEYDFKQLPTYEIMRNNVAREVEKDFAEMVKEEEEEREDYYASKEAALRAGEDFEIDEIIESGVSVINEDYKNKLIDEKTYDYMSHYYELNANVVLDVDASGSYDKESLRKAVSEQYNVPVVSIKEYGEAKNNEILRQMTYDSMLKMFESKDYTNFLDLKANLSKYSLNNIAMVYKQRPNAIAVKGSNDWFKNYKRPLIVGEAKNGIKIWRPLAVTLTSEKDIDKFLSSAFYDSNSTTYKRKHDSMMRELNEKGKLNEIKGYTIGYVYDISQTRPLDRANDNYDLIVNLRKPLTEGVENAEEVGRAIATTLKGKDATFDFDKDISISQNLYNAIYKDAAGIFASAPQSVTGIKSNDISSAKVQKIESLIATYLTCKHIGIDCADKVALELTNYMNKDNIPTAELILHGRKEIFGTAFDRGSCYANQFIKAFDTKYNEILIDSPLVESRIEAVRRGCNLSKFVNDESPEVRTAVANAYFGLEKLKDDKDTGVRSTAMERLDYLATSKDSNNRILAAKCGYALDILCKDVMSEVRAEVAKQGYALDILCKDKFPSVLKEVARQGYALEQLKKSKYKEVREVASETEEKLAQKGESKKATHLDR